jgi:hypothetical protein
LIASSRENQPFTSTRLFSSCLYTVKKCAISFCSWSGTSSSVSSVFQPGSVSGTARTLSSTPWSSSIRNSAIGLTSIMQPGKVGSETHTITSSGSPSSDSVSGTKP